MTEKAALSNLSHMGERNYSGDIYLSTENGRRGCSFLQALGMDPWGLQKG